jgi:hypothetical protein
MIARMVKECKCCFGHGIVLADGVVSWVTWGFLDCGGIVRRGGRGSTGRRGEKNAATVLRVAADFVGGLLSEKADGGVGTTLGEARLGGALTLGVRGVWVVIGGRRDGAGIFNFFLRLA